MDLTRCKNDNYIIVDEFKIDWFSKAVALEGDCAGVWAGEETPIATDGEGSRKVPQ